MQQIRDHQETIISLHDSASSVVSGHMTFCRIDRKPSFMPFNRDQKTGSDTVATCVRSNTVPSMLKGLVSRCSKIPIATNTTPHPEASPAASTDAANNNIQSQEHSSRDPHAGSDPMRFDRILEEAILNLFGTSHKLYPMSSQHQLWMLRGTKKGKNLDLTSFPIHQLSHFGR